VGARWTPSLAAAFAATPVITGGACLEARLDAGDILATMDTDSQAGALVEADLPGAGLAPFLPA
jgi:hypothetical protein